MFSIFTCVMSRVTHSEPGLPMAISLRARVTFSENISARTQEGGMVEKGLFFSE